MGDSAATATATTTFKQLVPANEALPKETRRCDYKPPEYFIKHCDLQFKLDFTLTQVCSVLTIYRSPGTPPETPLELHGHPSVHLTSLAIRRTRGGEPIRLYSYRILSSGNLIIPSDELPNEAEQSFEVHAVVEINPTANTELQGLFKAGPILCTQCEAEGFRAITYFLDRPDVMASFKVRLEASKSQFPVLLSNGNKIDGGDIADGERHFLVYEDPHLKPAYLFAVVAGDLQAKNCSFMRMNGEPCKLSLWCEPKDIKKLDWALDSLQQAMKWDEEKFGRVYDCAEFNLVAVSYFNMGAMENKSLNIFNSALLLASQETTTDGQFSRIQGVVGHEYFHNWTGNRITCRDWFQLTLKEGLTVYRDQEFSSDMGSRAVQRIQDVNAMKAVQFAEDDGPMRHPIRPEKYQEIDNFYTSTVYQKGAEVIRMLATILGRNGFRKGMDLYFDRHDGQAVTCEDFQKAMADANGVNLEQFGRWYAQAGTPLVRVISSSYDGRTYKIAFNQENPNDPTAEPLHIPIAFGLVGKNTKRNVIEPTVLHLKERTQEFEIRVDEGEDCVPSILRNFSAPVKLSFTTTNNNNKEDEEETYLGFLMAYDTDEVNRWEAGQKLMIRAINLTASSSGAASSSSSFFCDLNADKPKQTIMRLILRAFEEIINAAVAQKTTPGGGSCDDKSFAALLLTLPSAATVISEADERCDPLAIAAARRQMQRAIAEALARTLEALYASTTSALNARTYDLSEESVGLRRLRNTALEYLTCRGSTALACAQYRTADNMNDRFAALSCISHHPGPDWEAALQDFFERAQGEELVLLKWFEVQAGADTAETLSVVERLKRHPQFDKANPNFLRSLIGRFTRNVGQFHRSDGAGYRFLGDCIAEIDPLNSRMAARLASELISSAKFDIERQQLMEAELAKLAKLPPSSHLREIISKGLQKK